LGSCNGGGGVILVFFKTFLLGWAEDLSSLEATFFAGGGPATPFTDCSLALLGVVVTVLAVAATDATVKAAINTNTAIGFMAISCPALKTGNGTGWLPRLR
jgi:hypothetical protein